MAEFQFDFSDFESMHIEAARIESRCMADPLAAIRCKMHFGDSQIEDAFFLHLLLLGKTFLSSVQPLTPGRKVVTVFAGLSNENIGFLVVRSVTEDEIRQVKPAHFAALALYPYNYEVHVE